jgi:hypothetical protein
VYDVLLYNDAIALIWDMLLRYLQFFVSSCADESHIKFPIYSQAKWLTGGKEIKLHNEADHPLVCSHTGTSPLITGGSIIMLPDWTAHMGAQKTQSTSYTARKTRALLPIPWFCGLALDHSVLLRDLHSMSYPCWKQKIALHAASLLELNSRALCRIHAGT